MQIGQAVAGDPSQPGIEGHRAARQIGRQLTMGRGQRFLHDIRGIDPGLDPGIDVDRHHPPQSISMSIQEF